MGAPCRNERRQRAGAATAHPSGVYRRGCCSHWSTLRRSPASFSQSRCCGRSVLGIPRCSRGWWPRRPLLVAGVGSGLFIAPNADFIVATVASADAGAASGVIGTMQRVGNAIGIAVIGTVLFGTLHIHPVAAGPALAFGHSAAPATAVSAGLSIAAFALGFLLPQRVSAPRKRRSWRPIAGA
jgi:hypothetical protein